MLFAPVFSKFGCDISHSINEMLNDDLKVHGLCTGGPKVVKQVRDELGIISGKFWDLNTELEWQWINEDINDEEIIDLGSEITETGAFGRILTADRQIGVGLVSGGKVSSSPMVKYATSKPNVYPRNYICNLIKFMKSILDETNPDAVFCYAVAGAPAVCLAELCSIRSIPFLRLTSTRIGEGNIVDTDARGRLKPIEKVFNEAKNNNIDLSLWIEQAKDELYSFQEKPMMPGYMIYNAKNRKNEHLLPEVIKSIKNSSLYFASVVLQKNVKNIRKYQLVEAWKKSERIWCRKKLEFISPFSEKFPMERSFIYYPLHLNPEASTMVLSPMHTNQISIIEALSKSAPPYLDIVVKEHSPMLGLRPKGFYDKIKQLPRVTLLGPEHNGLELIRQSALTVVITGTAAWEAVRLKKPAIVIGDSPYLAINEGIVHSPCLTDLPKKIVEALNMLPASNESLLLYLAAINKESFEMKTSLLWGNYMTHSSEERIKVSKTIAQHILNRIN